MTRLLQALRFLARDPWTRLWVGLPAVAVLALGAASAAALALVPETRPVSEIVGEGRRRVAKGDYESARLLAENALIRRPNDPDLVYLLATASLGQGNLDRGVALLKKLAPLNDKSGHVPARLALASLIVAQPAVPDADLRAAETQLLLVLETVGEHPSAHELLGDLYLRRGDAPAKAVEHYRAAEKHRPDVRAKLGVACARAGDPENARRWNMAAVDHFRSLVDADMSNDAARVAWATVETRLGRHDEAIRVLRQGYDATRDPVYRKYIAATCAAAVRDVQRDDPANLADQVRFLERGLDADPANRDLLRQLALLSQGDEPASEPLRKRLKQELADGRASASLHFALGIAAHGRGDEAAARLHFERALELDERGAPEIANNLAYHLATQEPVDLPRALELAEAALRKFPDSPNLLDTRGVILVKLGKVEQGVADLERALRSLGPGVERHQALADAYEALGDPELAALHRDRAENARRAKNPTPGS